MKICLVGMGLMGGSLALALKGFHDATIIGMNRSQKALNNAKDVGAIQQGILLEDDHLIQCLLQESDLVILCLYPQECMDFIEKHAKFAKNGSVWTDVVGIKMKLIECANDNLPETVEFVGAHPMAGREVSGFDAAIATLFQGCNYVITPTVKNSPQAIALIKELAQYIGVGRITIATAQKHDQMIAYTSQMAHVLAAAIVDHPLLMESKGFEGGSFGDLTRVASLNAKMWSSLFMLNKAALLPVLDELQERILNITDLVHNGDQDALEQHLDQSSRRKEAWNHAQDNCLR